jgi:hypothetical protein
MGGSRVENDEAVVRFVRDRLDNATASLAALRALLVSPDNDPADGRTRRARVTKVEPT